MVDLLIVESGVRFERFQVFGTGFFDESDLSQVRLGQSRSFPPWRQRTGSAVLEGSEGGNRLGERQAVTPVEKTPPAHREIYASDDHFRSAATTVESTQGGPDSPPEHVHEI